jgi:Lrp/AsnC family leucine-responsive transcriptional regulator
MPALDAIDRKILSLLQSDGRMTMQELSDRVGLSVSPCHRRVKLLEERGVITRYIATVDQKAVGLHVSVFISIKLARQKEEDLDRFARAISKWDEVLECYLMTGNRDYLLRVVAADLSSYEGVPEEQADAARRHRLDRVELCAEPGEIFHRVARMSFLSPPLLGRMKKVPFLDLSSMLSRRKNARHADL